MKRPILLPLLCLAALGGCIPKETNQYIGEDPKLVFQPKYLVDQELMQADDSKPGVDWGMSLVWLGDHYMVSADRNTTPDQLTQVWQVVAVQDIPLLRKGQIIAMGSCVDRQVPNSRVVAVVDYDSAQQWLDHFEGAWAYDFAKGEFEPYSTAHLLCFNARFGLALDAPGVMTATPLPAIPAPSAITH